MHSAMQLLPSARDVGEACGVFGIKPQWLREISNVCRWNISRGTSNIYQGRHYPVTVKLAVDQRLHCVHSPSLRYDDNLVPNLQNN